MPNVKDVVPTFFVSDLRKSVDWYQRVLGFKTAFLLEDYAGLDLGPARIHLAQHQAKNPAVVYKGACYLRLDDGVDEYVSSILAKGQKLTSPLKNHDYGMREATVRDPDGNDLYVGQPLSR